MMRKFRFTLSLLLMIGFAGCNQQQTVEAPKVQIAFMADVHLQDLYGEFSDSEYKGVENPGTGQPTLARTMNAQLNSTRIYNENYFAFLAALDDVVRRGVNYVVLPGDFSDDGQPVNVRGLKKILDRYTETYGIRFLATTGNHDPVRPFSMDAGKSDFLGEGGKPQAIMSKAGMYNSQLADENPVVISTDIRKMGYEEIIGTLANYGFFPKQNDLYWETPFTSYSYDNYSFDEALRQSSIKDRNYPLPPYNSLVPDVSYLVEPEQGLWFLALDANVYLPTERAKNGPENPSNYEGSSTGYVNVLTHKKHLTDWVKKVAREAEKRDKTLIVFSHYPMIDFNDDASENIENLMGKGKMQLHRVPGEQVAKTFAEAGIRLHFGGHMHINDTGVRNYGKGVSLVNIQIPSLAAYIPAYKLLTVKNYTLMEVETIVIDSVPRFKELFPLYEQEYAYLEHIGAEDRWNKDILSSASYHEFTNWHLQELVRLRFLKNDWPAEFRDFLLNATGRELLEYTGATAANLAPFDSWTGFDMIFDFYRLRSADKLAIRDIGMDRIRQYQQIIDSLLAAKQSESLKNDRLQHDFHEFATILHHFMNGAPADHFLVDLVRGEVVGL
ncbi:metallophosphoesterase [Mangrovibacterium sp.]|uniref:metallophosphoesterase family protein n=1 Tax=Mangrovibacterium sp. TaxID=1961364 RepID=UPI0035629DA8